MPVAAIAMINNSVANSHSQAGESAGQALAAGLGASALAMAIWSVLGILLIGLMRRHHLRQVRAVDRAAAAASPFHTIPTEPTPSPQATPEPKVAV